MIKKIVLVSIGVVAVFLGILGIILPILPTTPFLLLAATCFLKSSDHLYNRLINNRILGVYIRNYHQKLGIPLKVKVYVLSLLWVSISYSAFIVIESIYLKIMLLLIAIFVTIHILKQKTIREKKEKEDDSKPDDCNDCLESNNVCYGVRK